MKTSVQGTNNDLIDKLNKRLRKLFESKGKIKEPEVFKSLRNLYSSCMEVGLYCLGTHGVETTLIGRNSQKLQTGRICL